MKSSHWGFKKEQQLAFEIDLGDQTKYNMPICQNQIRNEQPKNIPQKKAKCMRNESYNLVLYPLLKEIATICCAPLPNKQGNGHWYNFFNLSHNRVKKTQQAQKTNIPKNLKIH